MIDLNFERQLATVEDVERIKFYPPSLVCKWVCLRTGMREAKFRYHVRQGFLPTGTVKVDGEWWYDDAGVQRIIDLCKARKWDRTNNQ